MGGAILTGFEYLVAVGPKGRIPANRTTIKVPQGTSMVVRSEDLADRRAAELAISGVAELARTTPKE